VSLIADECLGNVAVEKVLPSNGMLMDGRPEEWVIPGVSVEPGWVVEPLDEIFGDQFLYRLCCITLVIEVIQLDYEKDMSLGFTNKVGAAQ
jgi:hypothetical protein